MGSILIWARRHGPWRRAVDGLAASPRLALALVAFIPATWIVFANLAPLAQMAVISLLDRYPLPPGEPLVWTPRHYVAFFERPLYFKAFVRSFVFATSMTALTLVVMFPVAYYIARIAPPGARLRLLLLVVAPFWVSEIVRSVAWILMLANRGAVNSALEWLGIAGTPYDLLYNNVSLVLGVLYLTSLYMLLPLYAALEKIDNGLLEAAAGLGASPARRLVRIILPLSRDGIVAGCTLVFLLVIGLYAMPQLLGGPNTTLFATTIGQVFARAGDSWPLGSALSVILIAASLGWVAVLAVLFRRKSRGTAS